MGRIQSVTISSKYNNDKFSNEDLLDFAEMLYKSGMIKVNTTYNSETENTEMIYSMTLWLDDNQMKIIDKYNKSCHNEEDEFNDMAEKFADTYHNMNGQHNIEDFVEESLNQTTETTKVHKNWLQRLFSGNPDNMEN